MINLFEDQPEKAQHLAIYAEDVVRSENRLMELREEWEKVKPRPGEFGLGTFEITSGNVMVSDPCYEVGTWCQGTLENVKTGTWTATVIKSDAYGWGVRCTYLIVQHKDTNVDLENGEWVNTGIDVGVDSGQAGIFDVDVYKNDSTVARHSTFIEDDQWYSSCCDQTLGLMNAGVIPGGAVSSSGFGDGSYEAFTISKDDEIVAIKIVFIDEYDEEEDEDEAEGF